MKRQRSGGLLPTEVEWQLCLIKSPNAGGQETSGQDLLRRMCLAGYQCAQRAAKVAPKSPEFAVVAYLNLGRKGRVASWAVYLRSGEWKQVSHDFIHSRAKEYPLVWKSGFALDMGEAEQETEVCPQGGNLPNASD